MKEIKLFEKEAEDSWRSKGLGYKVCADERSYKTGFQDGYNKANEWHFVKDGDLPKTEFSRVDVTVAYINAYQNPCKTDCCFDGNNFIYFIFIIFIIINLNITRLY